MHIGGRVKYWVYEIGIRYGNLVAILPCLNNSLSLSLSLYLLHFLIRSSKLQILSPFGPFGSEDLPQDPCMFRWTDDNNYFADMIFNCSVRSGTQGILPLHHGGARKTARLALEPLDCHRHKWSQRACVCWEDPAPLGGVAFQAKMLGLDFMLQRFASMQWLGWFAGKERGKHIIFVSDIFCYRSARTARC